VATLVVARDGSPTCVVTTGMAERQAHDAAARLWFGDPKVLAVVVFSDAGQDAGRYERPGAVLPADWPPRDARYVSQDAVEPLHAPREGQAPRQVPPEPVPRGPSCGCCGVEFPPGGSHAGDDDPTPAGRVDLHRCPECGSPQPGATRQDLERRYLGTRREAVHVVEPEPRPRSPTVPVDWRRGS